MKKLRNRGISFVTTLDSTKVAEDETASCSHSKESQSDCSYFDINDIKESEQGLSTSVVDVSLMSEDFFNLVLDITNERQPGSITRAELVSESVPDSTSDGEIQTSQHKIVSFVTRHR